MSPAPSTSPAPPTPSIVIVGAGPRGTGFLERLAANLPELYGDGPLDLHLVDPHPPGPGRIWRTEQSPLLWMNSQAEDVTMFTDETVRLDGPVLPGPTLADWAGIEGRTFPTRPQQGAYLRWVYERALAALPVSVTVHEHRTSALRIGGPRDGRQRVWLEAGAEPLLADLVVLTVGHLDAEPDPEQRALAGFAARHRLVHLPPDFTADSDLSALPAGEPVLVRGFGLAFVDLMVLLTEGRGGRYEGEGDDLVYVPSGREPVLHVGSRRGVPYHSKIGYALDGERPPLPRFFGGEQVEALLERAGPLDFRRDVWPLIDKELGWAHYHRLFSTHPERTSLDRTSFEEAYAQAPPRSAEIAALVAAAVPDPADRLDLDALDHPLDGVRFVSAEALQHGLRDYITDDLARRHDPAHSPDAAVFAALLSVYAQLLSLGGRVDLGGWWHGFFSYLASGPPGPRLRQLLALSRAGVVRFLGPQVTVETDEERGVFRAASAAVPGEWTEARALVEARLPEPTLELTGSPLLRALYEDGARATASGLLVVDPADGRILERDGRSHPRRFALGPHTTARAGGAFTRPRTGGIALGQNDAAARAALTFLSEQDVRSEQGDRADRGVLSDQGGRSCRLPAPLSA
ncbi:FAD/NAD(P)-binding protein [Streptomyces sp. NPDC056943]|uniref:FAD/NAD(P)-binding protein n=1 Tax=Streptomyces sp. NPDC056943 TaxID=3345971 RepID=UPI0036437DCB